MNSAFTFDGTSAYVHVPFSPSYDFLPSGQFTIETWANAARVGGGQTGYRALVVKCPDNDAWDWGLYINPDNTFMAGRHNNHFVNSVTVARVGQWYHVVVTYYAGSWTLFVNGIAEGSYSGASISQSSGALAFGRKGESTVHPDLFEGQLDEVTLYNRALTGPEIAALFGAGSQGKCIPPTRAVTPS